MRVAVHHHMLGTAEIALHHRLDRAVGRPLRQRHVVGQPDPKALDFEVPGLAQARILRLHGAPAAAVVAVAARHINRRDLFETVDQRDVVDVPSVQQQIHAGQTGVDLRPELIARFGHVSVGDQPNQHRQLAYTVRLTTRLRGEAQVNASAVLVSIAGHWRGLAFLAVVALTMFAAYLCRVDEIVRTQGQTAALPQIDLRIAMITHGGIGDPFWDQVAAGAQAAQREFGVELRYDGDGDINAQVRLVDNAIASGYDVLIVSLADPDALENSVRAAVEAGLMVLSINSGEERGREFGATTHFGQPDQVAGLAAGERMAAAGVSRMLCIIHEQGNIGLLHRCNEAGLSMNLAGGEFQTMFVTGTSNIRETTNEIASVLLANPSIDGVLALNSEIAELAQRAISEVAANSVLATFDISSEVLQDIERGSMLFAVDQQAYLQGFLPIAFAYVASVEADLETSQLLRALKRWSASGRLLTGPGFVDASNVRRYPEIRGPE